MCSVKPRGRERPQRNVPTQAGVAVVTIYTHIFLIYFVAHTVNSVYFQKKVSVSVLLHKKDAFSSFFEFKEFYPHIYFRSPPWWWYAPAHAKRRKQRRALSCSQCCCLAQRWSHRKRDCTTTEELTEISSLPCPLFQR